MISISDSIEGALIAFGAEYSESTVRIYRVHLKQFYEYLDVKHVSNVSQLNEKIFFEFYTYMKNDYVPKRFSGDTSVYTPASLANVWCALRMYDKFLSSEFHSNAYTLKLKKPRWKSPEIIPYTREEIVRLLNNVLYMRDSTTNNRKSFKMRRSTGKRDYFLFMLLLDTGLRAGEISRLNVRDYDQESGEIRITPFGTGRKTKPRTIYLGKSAMRAAWRYLSERKSNDHIFGADPLLLTNDGLARMNRNAIRLICQRTGDRAGVKNCHPHRFRHTFAIEYLRNGGNIYILSEKLLGHSDLTITRRYLAIVDNDAKTEHRHASPADNWRL